MPVSLSKLKNEHNHPNTSFKDYAWYIKSKDNPKDLVDTPHQQELKQWRKAVNGIYKARKEVKKECQQFSPNYSAKETSP